MSVQGLIIVDIQNDYFPEGKWEQHEMNEAAKNAERLLKAFRANGRPVFHVQHVFDSENAPFFAPNTSGAEIHTSVAPTNDEPVFVKNTVNPFISTDLLDALKAKGVTEVVVIGAQGHMCIDATARAASDFGLNVTVVHDACASRALTFADKTIAGEDVHTAYMAALNGVYATVTDTESVLNR